MSAKQERALLTILLALVAAGSLLLHFYNRKLAAEAAGGTYVPKEEKITPEIVRLQQYVRIDTSNPPGNEIAGARWLGAILSENRIPFEIIESAPARGNLYARIRGKQRGDALLLLNHIDVVPADPSQWRTGPFAADIQINMMWGRGTLDMKGITICQLEAFIALARSGRVPEHDVVFLATADEERGGALGVEWLLEHRPDVFDGVRYALNEGGITETTQERLSYFGIEIGSKLVVTAWLRSDSRDELRRARIALEPRITPDEPDRLLPEVQQYFHDLAPVRIAFKPYLADIAKTIRDGEFWQLPRNYRELLQNTLFVDGPRASGDHFIMRVHMANLPDELPEERLAWLRSALAAYRVEIESVERRDGPGPMTSPETPFFRMLQREVRGVYGNVPVGTIILNASFSDSRFLRRRGIVCYGVWPFPVDLFQTLGIHHADERIRLDWFMKGVELTRRIVAAHGSGASG